MGEALEVNASEWEQTILLSDTLTVVDFWHENCPWCLLLNPVFEEVAGEYKGKIKFATFNALKNRENREIAIRYGVMSTPTLMFFCASRPVDTFVGFMQKENLKKKLDDLLETYKECIKQSTELKI